MKGKGPDMDFIAQRMGVSKTTVHYALHNTGRVSQPLRKRILALAKKLNYRPNLLARGLRSNRTATIGVVAVNLSSSYHAKLVEGIEDAARATGRSILLACSYFEVEREREAVELLIDKGVDGLIVAPADTDLNTDFYRKRLKDGAAIVCVDREIQGLKLDSVATDNVLGGHLAGQHLLRLGRKKFGIAVPSLRGSRPTSVQGRLAGFNRALREAKVSAPVLIGPDVLDNTPESAYRAFRRFFAERGACIDAIFAVNDGLAYGAIRAIVEHGARTPDDIAVVGFDDQEASAYIQPPLTTVRQPMREIGAEAVRLLDPQRRALSLEFVARSSEGPGKHFFQPKTRTVEIVDTFDGTTPPVSTTARVFEKADGDEWEWTVARIVDRVFTVEGMNAAALRQSLREVGMTVQQSKEWIATIRRDWSAANTVEIRNALGFTLSRDGRNGTLFRKSA